MVIVTMRMITIKNYFIIKIDDNVNDTCTDNDDSDFDEI